MEGVAKKPDSGDEKQKEEVIASKVEEKKEEEKPAQAAPRLCLVLETDLRTWLRHDKLKHKKGHNRKLTKKESEEVEEKVRFWFFDVQKYKESVMRATMDRMQEAPEFVSEEMAAELTKAQKTEDEEKKN